MQDILLTFGLVLGSCDFLCVVYGYVTNNVSLMLALCHPG